MKKQFLECGKIVTTHGVRGEVRVQPWCDAPEFLLEFDTLYLEKGQQAIAVQRARVHKNIVILQLEGVGTVEEAVKLRGKVLYVNRNDVPMDDGEYFVQDFIDCTVTDVDTGADYGKIYDRRQRRLLSAGRLRHRAAGPRDTGCGIRAGYRRRCNPYPPIGGAVR